MGCFQSVEVRRADINHDDVGVVLGSQFDGLAAGTRLSADIPSGMLLDQHAEAFSNQVVIISNQDT